MTQSTVSADNPKHADQPWLTTTAKTPVTGLVSVPGSKSQSNRALVLASLASRQTSTITGILDCRDTQLMIAGLKKMGVAITATSTDQVEVTGPTKWLPASDPGIDCGLAGTVMRFLPPISLLADGTSFFYGDDQAAKRPMAGLLAGLSQLGAVVTGQELPFSVTAPQILGNEIEIDSSASSQFISGLLMVAPLLPGETTIRHVGSDIPSAPHIEMTVKMLADRQVDIECPSANCWIVPEQMIAGLDENIEPDLTTSAAFLAAAALTGGKVSVPRWPSETTQPGKMIVGILEKMGAKAELSNSTMTVFGTGQLSGQNFDLSKCSELTPVVAGLAAFASGETVIRGVGHIRGHETDRIMALVEMLNQVGVAASELPDGLRITGSAALEVENPNLKPALVSSYADHRMAHVGALLGLLIPGVRVDDVSCTSKTLPGFDKHWQNLVDSK